MDPLWLQGANFQNAFKDVAAMPEGGTLDADGADPFARRKTVSRNYWSTRQKDAGAAEEGPSPLIISCLAGGAVHLSAHISSGTHRGSLMDGHCDTRRC
jgi:hypothetical protein